MATSPTDVFRAARDLLWRHREDYEAAYRSFRWPALDRFNWARDWFDVIARENRSVALRVLDDDGESGAATYADLSEASTRVACSLHALGARPGDRLLLMLGNGVPLWETFLAAMKLGVVVVPATPQLGPRDLEDRFSRGRIRHVVTDPAGAEKLDAIGATGTRILVGARRDGWIGYESLRAGKAELPPVATRASDPLLLYFTSGTTAQPKLVLHTHASYPVGHLSTMYWIGLRRGDVHFNISSPGWAKHAWSSIFAPWNAEATVVAYDYRRFAATRALGILRDQGVTTLCAPPTVWRLVILETLGARPAALREAVSAGEPLNPEVIERVRAAWGVTIRDGYGQTETTAQIGNPPGRPVQPGAMGRPLPGYRVALVDAAGKEASQGEVALVLEPRPLGLMVGYEGDPDRTARVTAGGYYRTGDEARRDASGEYWYEARADDVFKCADYRLSPFELESALLEHPSVAEAAVVARPDPLRLNVPKAFVVLRPGIPVGEAAARALFEFLDGRLAPYQRIRRIEFAELPKTVSGKIRRAELRKLEAERQARGETGPLEFTRHDSSGKAG